MICTVPRRFESLLESDPFAPALVLTRTGCRDRVWVRAAVEHRAVRLAGACALRGLASQARVAFTGHGALDRLAVAHFVLSTGRVLVEPGNADFDIDDEICRQSEIRATPYMLRCAVQSGDPAADFGRALNHGELYRLVIGGRAPDTDLGHALASLAQGEPLEIPGDVAVDLRALVYAA